MKLFTRSALLLLLLLGVLRFEALAQVEGGEEPMPAQRVEEGKARFKFEIGGLGGFFGAATGIIGEVRLPLPYIFGPATSSFRIAGGVMQSEDTSRRYAPIMVDGIFNFPAGYFTGVENYLGVGLNYVVLTTGRKSGTFGGEIFYGVESEGFGGKVFGEMGYGILRHVSKASEAHQGVTILVGYRREWSF